MTEESSKNISSFNSHLGTEWQIARKYMSSLGQTSALFSGCCRSLINSSEHSAGQLSKRAAGQLARLLRSPSMLAQVFYASKTYYPNDIAARGQIEPADFIFFISPKDLALIITIGFSTRRLTQVLNPQDWELLWDPYQRYIDLAVPLGLSIPIIGPSKALMVAAGKFLGWGFFALKDPENFKKYRVANKVQKRAFSLGEEMSLFGTTHLHISSLIYQTFGFGITVCEEYYAGLSTDPTEKLTAGAIPYRVARIWLESLLEQGTPPTTDLGDEYELEQERSEKLIELFNSIKEHGSEHKWLNRSRADLGPDKTPELIADYDGLKALLKRKGRGLATFDEEEVEG